MWQHKRPAARGDDDSGAEQAIQQLRAAREKHKTAMSEKRSNESRANACGWLLGCTLAAWLCSFSLDIWTLALCLIFGLALSYLFLSAVQVLTRLQDDQRRAILTETLLDEELRWSPFSPLRLPLPFPTSSRLISCSGRHELVSKVQRSWAADNLGRGRVRSCDTSDGALNASSFFTFFQASFSIHSVMVPNAN